MLRIHKWLEMSSPALARVAASGNPVALLPVAAVEQHGPHLPLSTDVTIGNGIIASALDALDGVDGNCDLLLVPPLMLGASLEHTRFPGTLSLPVEQAIAQLRAVGAGVARAGIQRLLVFNSHGGNQSTVDAAALQLRSQFGLLVVKLSYYRHGAPEGLIDADELQHGVHGGQLETSMMLHLAPDLVNQDAMRYFESLGAIRARAGLQSGVESPARFAWLADDLNPDGVAGHAEAATAEIGAELVAWYGQQLAATILETASFDLSGLAAKPKQHQTSVLSEDRSRGAGAQRGP